MEMDSGQDDSSVRGTKRKHDGDESEEMRGPSTKLIATADPRLSPPAPTSDTDTIPGSTPSRPRDDAYFKALYTSETDYAALGRRDPAFQAVLQRRGGRLDLADPAALVQLTQTLLRLDFGLRVELPTDRLCPPVPNRHAYILWLKALLDTSAPSFADAYDPDRAVVGIDVGTGASLVYPLLGCAQRAGWSFVATDIDAVSLAHARANAARNNLAPRIRIVSRPTSDTAPLLPLDDLGLARADFCMTNPPFYASAAELAALARAKAAPPAAACTGAPVEMVCAGGEVGFARGLLAESRALRVRVQWYTAMLGRRASLDALVADLRAARVDNYAVAAFAPPGARTRRWALAWSFEKRRPCDAACRGGGVDIPNGRSLLPPPTEATVAAWPASGDVVDLRGRIERVLRDVCESLDLASWSWGSSRSRGTGFADRNVWGRAYRREKARAAAAAADAGGTDKSHPSPPEQCAFGFAVSVRVSRDGPESNGDVAIDARWLQGDDHALFESLVGFLRNSIRLPSK
ncbi:hypothetical protein GGR52DRAFT_590423 [Hypoxylon sp. FL1284]|nr:hypothetical protein GGR52DRAFT_590423 [Hypoxylon sp. FL1284]